MQVRKISNEVFKQFPELQEFSPTDFFQVWKSYEQELSNHLLNPTLPYLQFLTIGTFFIKTGIFGKKVSKLEKSIEYIDRWNIENADYLKLKGYLLSYRNVLEKKKEFFDKFLIYLDGWDTKDIKYYKWKQLEFQEYLDRIDLINKQYDERITASDLEKQSSNS